MCRTYRFDLPKKDGDRQEGFPLVRFALEHVWWDRFVDGSGYFNREGAGDPVLSKFKVLSDPGIAVGPGEQGGVYIVPLDGKSRSCCLIANYIMGSLTVEAEGGWIVITDKFYWPVGSAYPSLQGASDFGS